MALGELSPYMLWFCLSMRFKGRVRAIYKSERSTCWSLGRRSFDFSGGKDSFPRVMLITPEPGIRSTNKIWFGQVYRSQVIWWPPNSKLVRIDSASQKTYQKTYYMTQSKIWCIIDIINSQIKGEIGYALWKLNNIPSFIICILALIFGMGACHFLRVIKRAHDIQKWK